MTRSQELSLKEGLMKEYRKDSYPGDEDSRLLISLHSIEFSKKTNGYFEVANDIFFSNLLYLLYIKKVTAGNDFETAKDRAKSVLISELEKKRYSILASAISENEETLDSVVTGRKLILIDRAISLLETNKDEDVYCNYDVPENG